VRLWRAIQFDKIEVALLAQTGTSDIADAHVVICAQTAGYAVITSDPLDLKRLDPKLRLIRV
jgi:hypothetical protein